VHQDVVTPSALDNQYYKNVLAHKILFTSDAAFLTTPATTQMVLDNANIRGPWETKFNKAMVKMGAIGVKTGNQGEIRRNCRAVNHY
jgi:peroxidase